ncbi:unnamed protein product [Calypogeia fissa]
MEAWAQRDGEGLGREESEIGSCKNGMLDGEGDCWTMAIRELVETDEKKGGDGSSAGAMKVQLAWQGFGGNDEQICEGHGREGRGDEAPSRVDGERDSKAGSKPMGGRKGEVTKLDGGVATGGAYERWNEKGRASDWAGCKAGDGDRDRQ